MNIFQLCPKNVRHNFETITENVERGFSKTAPMITFHGIVYMYTSEIVKCMRCGQIYGHHTNGSYYRIHRTE